MNMCVKFPHEDLKPGLLPLTPYKHALILVE